ncbi:MAG: hypothetical protein U9R34_00575 [Nanoarchaeota archaeon]|nr:hypothetical protein [Nanoarchaeota archaeon]
MTEFISMTEMPKEFKIELLKELGYGSDDKFVLNKSGSILLDRYTEDQVRLDNMIILPGSEIILDNNPLSVSSYMEEFKDVL